VVQKIPPPPPIANADPAFNRWLLEVTAILQASGNIDPDAVAGLPEVIAQSAANAAAVTALQTQVGNQDVSIAALAAQVLAIQNDIVTINGQLTTLGARGELLFGAGAPAAGLGKVNDWYGDTAGAVGARIWIKKAVGVWTAFPF
jgi:hypothetical protein